MRRSTPPRVLFPLALAGVAVVGSLALSLAGAAAVLPMAGLGVALAGLALAIAGLNRHVLQPLDQVAEALDPATPADGAVEGHDAAGEVPPAPSVDLPALAARDDAVGRVAAAAIAHAEQSRALEALQAGVATGLASTMADVAHRELVLVNRLLEHLDALEGEETDPARLERLYALDHLAVRLRAQSENLLVVADAAPQGDPDEAPMALVDLVRVAASQTEDYRRVSADAALPGAVVGWAARPLAQLLAALLDNGLRFSPPTQPVTVTGELWHGGVRLGVRDRGIGMEEAALAAARATLAEPPLLEAARARRYGLYVVGVLARRLGVAVDLQPADDALGGVVATVDVARTLLDGASQRALPAAPVPAVTAEPADAAAAAPPLAPVAAAPPAPAPVPAPVADEVAIDLASELGWAAAPSAPAPPAAPAAGPAPTPGTPQPLVATASTSEEAAAPAVGDGGGRRRRRRAEVAWSIALTGGDASAPATPTAADPTFVADVSTWTATPEAPPASWLVSGPTMPSRPVTGRDRAASPVQRPPAPSEEPDDYIPPIVDNPLLDILPDHPTAHLAPVLPVADLRPAAPTGPVVEMPTVMTGIRVAGSPAAAAPLPSRPQDRRPADRAVPPLFGAAPPPLDDPADITALAGLMAVDEEGTP